jgi:hypothetical protein
MVRLSEQLFWEAISNKGFSTLSTGEPSFPSKDAQSAHQSSTLKLM